MVSRLLVALLYAAISFTAQAASHKINGKVVSVADGDTLTILDNNHEQHRVRLAEIDAPEKAQNFGQVSKQSLADLTFGKMADATCSDTDRYGRSVCKVVVDGINVNTEQVARGYAWVYAQYASKFSVLHGYQLKAKADRKGLWSDPKPVPPWEWRRESK